MPLRPVSQRTKKIASAVSLLVAVFAIAITALAIASDAQAQSTSLTATVNGDKSVDLALSNGPTDWWFRINSGTCTAVSGTAVNGIQGYQPGNHWVKAYSDNGCNTQIAETTFTIVAASLTATVNADSSVDLTLANGPDTWYFRITEYGTCTTASGNTVSNIKGYQPGTYVVIAYSKNTCKNLLAHTDFTIPEPPPSNATLTTTITAGPASNLTLTDGPNDWWFKIGNGSCTAASGATVSDIKGYRVGTHAVKAYSNDGCTAEIASASFTIPELEMTASVNDDWSVDLDVVGDPVDWWFHINWGHCTKSSGAAYHGIRGYRSGTYIAMLYPEDGCEGYSHDTAASFIIPTATLTTTVHDDRTVDLQLDNGPSDWWFRINSWGGCTATNGKTVTGIDGYRTGTHHVKTYSDAGCKYLVATAQFTLPPVQLNASNISEPGATLTISDYAEEWWYQANQGPQQQCQGPVAANTATKTLTGLMTAAEYTYTAYSNNNCATLLASTQSFTTLGLSVSNLAEAPASKYCNFGYPSGHKEYCAIAFTTGGNSGGYTLKNITGKFAEAVGVPGAFVTDLHTSDNNGNPSSQAKSGLTGRNPNTAGLHTYTCINTNDKCDLAADTTYFIVMSAADTAAGNYYQWQLTDSEAEATQPDANGWSIANVGRAKTEGDAVGWTAFSGNNAGHAPMIHIGAVEASQDPVN